MSKTMNKKCPDCKRSFGTREALDSHYGKMHSGSVFDSEKGTEMHKSGMTIQKIADVFGVSRWTVSRNIQKERPWRDKEKVQKLYQEKQLTIPELADEMNCSESTASRWLSKHGIETRDRYAESHRIRRKKPPYHRITKDGYEVVGTTVNGSTKKIQIHRLVAIAEHGMEEVSGNIVHHKNGIPWDNRPENLEVMSLSAHTKLHRPIDERWENRDKNI